MAEIRVGKSRNHPARKNAASAAQWRERKKARNAQLRAEGANSGRAGKQ